MVCLLGCHPSQRLLLFTSGHMREICLQLGILLSSLFVWLLFDRLFGVIDDNFFAPAGRLDGCGFFPLLCETKAAFKKRTETLV